MNMNWLESLFYGFISGISEFLPISSSGHQQILMQLFGVEARDPVRDLFVHIAMLIAVYLNCKPFLDLMQRERTAYRRHGHGEQYNLRAAHDWRLVQGAVLPMLITMLLLRFILGPINSAMFTVIFLIINGIILFLPERMVQGNKDARSMTAFDSVLIGCVGALSVFPGISRIGCTYSTSVVRGAAKKHALTWSLVLSIYALACLVFMDIIALFTVAGIHFWGSFFTYILSGLSAYLGSCVGISAVRFLFDRPSKNGFAYYCWGASLFSFILYLIVG